MAGRSPPFSSSSLNHLWHGSSVCRCTSVLSSKVWSSCFICNISNKRLVESRGSFTHLHTSTPASSPPHFTRRLVFFEFAQFDVWFDVFHVAAGDRCGDPQLRPHWTWLLMGAGGPITELLPEHFRERKFADKRRFHYVVTFLLFVKTFFNGTAD